MEVDKVWGMLVEGLWSSLHLRSYDCFVFCYHCGFVNLVLDSSSTWPSGLLYWVYGKLSQQITTLVKLGMSRVQAELLQKASWHWDGDHSPSDITGCTRCCSLPLLTHLFPSRPFLSTNQCRHP